jgi:iron complex outermembrane recepter protein
MGPTIRATAHTTPIIRSKEAGVAPLRSAALLAALLLAAGLGPRAAQAQTAPAPAPTPTADSDSQDLSEVVVTARRREERLIDVPGAVEVVSAADLENNNILDTKDLTRNVPNLLIITSFAGTGGTTAIRGISSAAANSDPGVAPEVAYNIDGINITQGRVATLGLFDVDRVEVLEGPQALYFGKNSPAGVVSITSIDPGQSLDGYLRVSHEFRLDQDQANAALTVPITDDLTVRFAGMAQQQRGYLENQAVPIVDPVFPQYIDPGAVHQYIDGAHQGLARMTVKYTPTDHLTVLVKSLYAYYYANSDGANQVNMCGPGINSVTVNLNFGISALDPAYNNCYAGGPRAVEGGLNPELAARFPGSNGGVPYSQPTMKLQTANISYDTDPLSITSITGYYRLMSHASVGIESSIPFYIGAQSLAFRQTSEELRATTKMSGPINFTFGGYFEDSKYRWLGNNYILPLGADTITNRIDSETYQDDATDRTWSAFGSLDWKLLPTLDLSAGARWTHETKLAVEQNTYLNDQPEIQFGFPFFLPVGQQIISPTTGNNVSPEVTLTWHARPELNVYGAFKTGYKSGGTSTAEVLDETTAANLAFKPEKAIGGELGVKGDLLDRALNFTFDVYNYNFQNLQVTSLSIIPNQPLFFHITNAAGARTQGAEFQVNYRVVPGFYVRSHLDYNRAFYTNYADAPCTPDQLANVAPGCNMLQGTGYQDLTGKQLELAPKWFGGAGFSYKVNLPRGLLLSFDGDWNYISSSVRAYGLAYYGVQGGYSIVNSSIRLSNPDKGWEIAVGGTNLTDSVTYSEMFNQNGFPPETYSGLRGPPREVTVSFNYTF